MSKEAYREKIAAQIDEQKARLDQARARAKGAAADARLDAEKQISALEEKIATARAQLEKLSGAGEDAWEDLKIEVERAWEDLSRSTKRFFSRLGD